MKETKLQSLVFKTIAYNEKAPQVRALFVAPNCFLIGDVVLEEGSSIWFGTSCRGDTDICRIGKNTAVMENCFIENSIIGNNTLLAHGVIAHHCQIGANVMVGVGARIIDGAKIGDNTLIGAGALILPHTQIPPNSVVLDKGKILRSTTEKDLALIKQSVSKVQKKAKILKETLSKS